MLRDVASSKLRAVRFDARKTHDALQVKGDKDRRAKPAWFQSAGGLRIDLERSARVKHRLEEQPTGARRKDGVLSRKDAL